MKFRSGQAAAATLAVAISCAAYPATRAEARSPIAMPGRVILAPGDDSVAVLRGGGVAATSARLHAAWLKSGHGEVAPQAGQALALRSGTVLSNTLRVGDPFAFPAVEFGFTAGTPGLGQADFTFRSAAGPRELTISYAPAAYTSKGSAAFAYPSAIPFYLAPGTWTLTGATLYDGSGASVTYTRSQIASLFTAATLQIVNNGPVDASAPVLGAGHLLTPTVSLSAVHPYLKATLPVTDSGTGVGFAILFLSPPGQSYAEGQVATIPLPVKSGTVSLYDEFFPGEPTGSWTFYEVQVCDVAGNCDIVTNKKAIFDLLGANSVTVTN